MIFFFAHIRTPGTPFLLEESNTRSGIHSPIIRPTYARGGAFHIHSSLAYVYGLSRSSLIQIFIPLFLRTSYDLEGSILLFWHAFIQLWTNIRSRGSILSPLITCILMCSHSSCHSFSPSPSCPSCSTILYSHSFFYFVHMLNCPLFVYLISVRCLYYLILFTRLRSMC